MKLQFISFVFVFFCNANFQEVNALNVVSHLSRFGYLPPEYKNSETANLITDESLKAALEDYQTFYGLNVTGVADEETLASMHEPRCGVPDKVWTNSGAEDYVLARAWKKTTITYKITQYSNDSTLRREKVDQVIDKVFQIWSKPTMLTFVKVTDWRAIDIEIRFESGDHKDGDPFDMGGYILAHAFYPGPGIQGDLHFNIVKKWTTITTGFTYRTRIDKVATHELGHSLGLKHSDRVDAVMYAKYKRAITVLKLSQDDIDGIKALYSNKSNTTTTGTKGTSGKGICSVYLNDYTLFTDYDQKTYFLSGNNYWQITDWGVANQQPQVINRKWGGIIGIVDAAFVYKGVTYLFQGYMCYAYRQSKLIPGYPMNIGNRFAGFPNSVDSVFVYKNKVYAFKGNQYWGYPASWGNRYPQLITLKWGSSVPTGINSAVTYSNGRYYFCKGDSYWRYNEVTLNIDKVGFNPYPRSFKKLWLHCS